MTLSYCLVVKTLEVNISSTELKKEGCYQPLFNRYESIHSGWTKNIMGADDIVSPCIVNYVKR